MENFVRYFGGNWVRKVPRDVQCCTWLERKEKERFQEAGEDLLLRRGEGRF